MTREVAEWYEKSDKTIIIGEMDENGKLTSGTKGCTNELLAIAVTVTVRIIAHSKMGVDEYCEILKDAYKQNEKGIFDDKSK